MKKLKIARVVFENTIRQEEIAPFRAAVAKKVPQNNVLLHHHLEDKLLYRYPLIQYKIYNGQPMIFSIDEGAEFITQSFLNLSDWNIHIYNKPIQLQLSILNLYYAPLQVWDKLMTYKIYQWAPLHGDNYEKYMKMPFVRDRINMLEQILKAHIISMAEGVKWNVDKKIEVHQIHIHKQKWITHKRIKWLTFDMSFATNVSLPNDIGLGKFSSLGFGHIRRIPSSILDNPFHKSEETNLESTSTITFNK